MVVAKNSKMIIQNTIEDKKINIATIRKTISTEGTIHNNNR